MCGYGEYFVKELTFLEAGSQTHGTGVLGTRRGEPWQGGGPGGCSGVGRAQAWML